MSPDSAGDAPIDLSTRKIAELYWEHYIASSSPLREQRLRVERGDLSETFGIFDRIFRDDARFDDVMVEIIHVLLTEHAAMVDDGLGYLAAGPIEDRWNDGDVEVLARLRARGVSQETIARIESGIWNVDPPSTPRLR
jgi:hypothetical protein